MKPQRDVMRRAQRGFRPAGGGMYVASRVGQG